MKFFTKEEALAVSLILLVIGTVSFFNFRVSLRRSRDLQRKSDIGAISDALIKYREDFGFLPLSSSDGKILACEPVTKEGQAIKFSPCEWGKNKIADLTDPTYPPYISSLPIDPSSRQGVSYLYLSDGNFYQLFSALEGKDDSEFNPKIEARRLMCGVKVCNFGKAYGKTPLDKSLEEYENELSIEKSKNNTK